MKKNLIHIDISEKDSKIAITKNGIEFNFEIFANERFGENIWIIILVS